MSNDEAVVPEGPLTPMLNGLPVFTSYHLTRWRQAYHPPKERFWEYEPKDYRMLQFFGLGHFTDKVGEALFVEFNLPGSGPVILTHPENLRVLLDAQRDDRRAWDKNHWNEKENPFA